MLVLLSPFDSQVVAMPVQNVLFYGMSFSLSPELSGSDLHSVHGEHAGSD